MSASGRALACARGTVAVITCALVAHATAYRSLWPSDGVHGYFGWYEPAVAVLSALSILAVAILLLAGLVGARGPRVAALRSLLRPRRPAGTSLAGQAAVLASSSLFVLLLQESVERSVELGRPAFALFAPSDWMLIVAALSALAVLVTWLTRKCAALLGQMFVSRGRRSPPPRLLCPADRPRGSLRRRNPLADRSAMRAPPALAG